MNVKHVTFEDDTRENVKRIRNSLIIEHVLLIYNLKYNLLNSNQFCNRCNRVIFKFVLCLIIHIIGNKIILIGKKLGNTYVIN
jgi:putative flippase GtrA